MSFEFTPENLAAANKEIAKYPEKRQASAVKALLDLAQRQNGGWVSQEIIEYVAVFLKMPFIRVQEVATFYTMFNLKPVGHYHIQVCTTTPCMLRGAEDIKEACEKHLSIQCGEVTKDGQFSMVEVECVGACVNAPVVQVNDDYFEDLTPETTVQLLNNLKHKRAVKVGSQINRHSSEPQGDKQ